MLLSSCGGGEHKHTYDFENGQWTWNEIETEFYLLKPRMAVSVGRKNLPKPFYEVILAAMAKVDNVEDDDLKMKNFDIFVKFFEAIVAYHKYEEEVSKAQRRRY